MLGVACSAGSDLTPMDQVVAGMGAGLAGTFVACPTELIKCRLQGGDKVRELRWEAFLVLSPALQGH